MRASLEKVHLATVLEASEAKTRDKSLKDEISHLNNLLKEECERSYSLALQVYTLYNLKFTSIHHFFSANDSSLKYFKSMWHQYFSYIFLPLSLHVCICVLLICTIMAIVIYLP